MYNTKEGKSCVIYIRVSSERQVKGYSLDGQKHYLAECAERRGMTVLDTYVEEGKSGKSIEGRTEFQRMLDDIQSGKVHTDYVLVFKLSRFGRNARDVLNSLEFIMKYGVHLMCVEDGLDSSTSMGKMMITILGAVAELERENIIAQSLLGREEKAKSGGWNGGFAPYGYRLVKGDDKSKGKLETVPEEKAVVQLVFDIQRPRAAIVRHERPHARANLQKAAVLQLRDAAVDDGAAHAHRLRQLTLRRQLLPHLQLAGEDHRFDVVDEQVLQRRRYQLFKFQLSSLPFGCGIATYHNRIFLHFTCFYLILQHFSRNFC